MFLGWSRLLFDSERSQSGTLRKYHCGIRNKRFRSATRFRGPPFTASHIFFECSPAEALSFAEKLLAKLFLNFRTRSIGSVWLIEKFHNPLRFFKQSNFFKRKPAESSPVLRKIPTVRTLEHLETRRIVSRPGKCASLLQAADDRFDQLPSWAKRDLFKSIVSIFRGVLLDRFLYVCVVYGNSVGNRKGMLIDGFDSISSLATLISRNLLLTSWSIVCVGADWVDLQTKFIWWKFFLKKFLCLARGASKAGLLLLLFLWELFTTNCI